MIDFIETTQSKKNLPAGFSSRIVHRNKRKPQRFEEPLTVVEFSLLPEYKEKLQKALHPFVERRGNYLNRMVLTDEEEASLKKIVEDHFPKEVIEYFKTLNVKKPAEIPPYVYVVRNLPETDSHPWEIDEDRTYAYWIGRGFALASGMYQDHAGIIERTHNESKLDLIGTSIHKHNIVATALNCLHAEEGTESPTRFVDVVGLKDDNYMSNRRLWTRSTKKWNSYLKASHTMLKPYQLEHHKSAHGIDEYSNQVILGKGDMAIWSEHGRLFHEAMPTMTKPYYQPSEENCFVRVAMYHDIIR